MLVNYKPYKKKKEPKNSGFIMSTLYENLTALCKEKGIKGARMCTDLGISKSLMTDLKMGRRSGVNAETAQRIASYFGVSVGYLLGKEGKDEKPVEREEELPENVKLLVEFAKQVPEDKAKLILKIMRLIVEDD